MLLPLAALLAAALASKYNRYALDPRGGAFLPPGAARGALAGAPAGAGPAGRGGPDRAPEDVFGSGGACAPAGEYRELQAQLARLSRSLELGRARGLPAASLAALGERRAEAEERLRAIEAQAILRCAEG